MKDQKGPGPYNRIHYIEGPLGKQAESTEDKTTVVPGHPGVNSFLKLSLLNVLSLNT